jgi:signal transduction histidine kinase
MLIASAVCLTLGAIHLRFWITERDRWDNLAFAVGCASIAVYSWLEIAMLHAGSPAEYGDLLRWAHVPAAVAIISIAAFVRFNLHARMSWLFWSLCGLRILTLILNFVFTPNINFRQITSIRQISLLGESVSIPVGVTNPWMLVGQIALLLFVLYCADGVMAAWRGGDRRKALIVGGGILLFALAAALMGIFVFWGGARLPLIISPFFLLIVVAIGYELNSDIRRSATLTEDLKKREAELREEMLQSDLSASAANVGIWTKHLGEEIIWASKKWRELLAFEASQSITFQDYLLRIHPDDRERVRRVQKAAEDSGDEYEVNYRLLLPNGGVRWIRSHGEVEFIDGEAKIMRGASVDITRQRLAEEAAHDLSRRLIGAQEKERARLARELHDDLSQSLALLAIQLEELGREPHEPGSIKKQVDHLASQIERLSADVHRISHELHPAKLGQLGLESALRGFCREIATAHGIKVDFDAAKVPRELPNDVSLCLYRIAQESLQNVVKHSGASTANVSICEEGGEVRLAVSDNGSGFDPDAPSSKKSIGLTSMKERARAVSGTLTVQSAPGTGSKIEVHVPLDHNLT